MLATLEYLREYRTYAHIAASYGIAESNIYRGIKWVEDTLIRDGTFSLPGRKAPLILFSLKTIKKQEEKR